VARPLFLLRTDPASETMGITSFSGVVQWVSCRDDDECLVLIGNLLNDRDLVSSDPVGVQLEYVGSWVVGSISDAAP